MIRYAHRLEVLAVDLESRFGVDDVHAREVRASIPKLVPHARVVRKPEPARPRGSLARGAATDLSVQADQAVPLALLMQNREIR